MMLCAAKSWMVEFTSVARSLRAVAGQVTDLDRKVKNIPIEVAQEQGVNVITHNIPSSGEGKPRA